MKPLSRLPSVLLVATLLAGLAPLVSAVPAADPITFNIDPRHSSIGFQVRHLGLSRVNGVFNTYEGSFTYDPDEPANSRVSVTIQTASLDTGVERRDNHLRSADFFEVDTYPTMTFESTSVRVIDAEHLEIEGDLTIRDTTRKAVLAAEFLGMAPMRGGQTSAFEATTTVNRHDYGLVWNGIQEGLQLVGDEVKITIQVEANTPRQ